MPGASRAYVAQSVPVVAAQSANSPSDGTPNDQRRSISAKLYSPTPDCCCSCEYPVWKSSLKPLLPEEYHGKVHPILRLYAFSLAIGARETAASVTSWLARWATEPLK